VQRFKRALAIFDASVDLWRRGRDLESVLNADWIVDCLPDGTCSAELAPASAAPRPPIGGPVMSGDGLDESTYDLQGSAEEVRVEVHVSRVALAQLVSGEELRLRRTSTADSAIELAEVKVVPLPG
jgi:hypothetical protein